MDDATLDGVCDTVGGGEFREEGVAEEVGVAEEAGVPDTLGVGDLELDTLGVMVIEGEADEVGVGVGIGAGELMAATSSPWTTQWIELCASSTQATT